jgi:hypothetical protein
MALIWDIRHGVHVMKHEITDFWNHGVTNMQCYHIRADIFVSQVTDLYPQYMRVKTRNGTA